MFDFEENKKNENYDNINDRHGDTTESEKRTTQNGTAREYEYGISYSSSSNSKTNDGKNINSNKNGSSAKKVIITLACSILLVGLCFASSMIGAKFSNRGFPNDIDEAKNEETTGNRSTIVFYEASKDITSIEDIPGSAGNKAKSAKEAYALVSDSVVEIQTETVQGGATFGQYITSGAGSGVIVGVDSEKKNEYVIVTNDHVISGATRITVILKDGTQYEASLIGSDVDTDIAVIKIKSDKELTCAQFGSSSDLAVGEDVIAIGNPLGELGGSLTDGIISALERNVVIDGIPMRLLQTNVAVNPGNSGGGLFNLAGELVGIVNAKYSDYDVEGLAFAIPSNTAKSIMKELIEFGYVKGRPSLGITVSERSSVHFGIVTDTYILITDPCGNPDLKVNDQIYMINGVEISTASDIKSSISGKSIGDTVVLTIYRNRAFIDVEVTLVEYVPTEDSIQVVP